MSGPEPDPWRRILNEVLAKEKGAKLADRIASYDDEIHTPEENVHWTSCAIRSMLGELSEDECIDVLNRCAHVLPDERIAELRETFLRTGDIFQVHQLWQQRFLENLGMRYGTLPPEWMSIIIDEGWGEAGRIEGRMIIATKVPQNLPGWFKAGSDAERRYNYCHCARVRQVFHMTDGNIPHVYCNCGGGFYRSNWERVVGRPVRVELRESLMKGDGRCSFTIILPDDVWSKG